MTGSWSLLLLLVLSSQSVESQSTTDHRTTGSNVGIQTTIRDDVDIQTTTRGHVGNRTTTRGDVDSQMTTRGDVDSRQTTRGDAGRQMTTRDDADSRKTTLGDAGRQMTTRGDVANRTTTRGDGDIQTTTRGDVHGDVLPKQEIAALSARQQQILEQLQLIVDHIGKLYMIWLILARLICSVE